MAICANLYERAGEGNPDDVAAKVRADGGIPDAQMVGDTEAAVKWMRAQPEQQRQGRAFTAPVPAAATPSSMLARRKTSTPASNCGAAAW